VPRWVDAAAAHIFVWEVGGGGGAAIARAISEFTWVARDRAAIESFESFPNDQ